MVSLTQTASSLQSAGGTRNHDETGSILTRDKWSSSVLSCSFSASITVDPEYATNTPPSMACAPSQILTDSVTAVILLDFSHLAQKDEEQQKRDVLAEFSSKFQHASSVPKSVCPLRMSRKKKQYII